MPRPAPYRQRLQRIRILFFVCFSIVGSYLLIAHADHTILPGLTSFKSSAESLDRYAYANEDPMGMMSSDADERGEGETIWEPPTRTLLVAKRLIDSGREHCADWTAPVYDEEMRGRRDSLCWKDTHHRQIKGYLNRAEVDKTYRDLS